MTVVVLGPHDQVVCPGDGHRFAPYFTDGACPLCGWQPTDAAIATPWTHRVDWLWVAYGAFVIVSIVMAIVVIAAL
jgi:hypothetical protein